MFQKIIILVACTFLLTGCADGFKGYFKKSANNKWIDSKGFHGGKRQPLYNKKYINVAKRNVLEENFDDSDEELDLDDVYEGRNPVRENREMYRDMLRSDAKRKQRRKGGRNVDDYAEEDYPSLNRANDRINKTALDDNYHLQKELAEIKAMLSEAKTDLTKYKCPIEGERAESSGRSKPSAKGAGDKSKASARKNDASLKDKYISEEDDYKQINSNVQPHEDTSSHPI